MLKQACFVFTIAVICGLGHASTVRSGNKKQLAWQKITRECSLVQPLSKLALAAVNNVTKTPNCMKNISPTAQINVLFFMMQNQSRLAILNVVKNMSEEALNGLSEECLYKALVENKNITCKPQQLNIQFLPAQLQVKLAVYATSNRHFGEICMIIRSLSTEARKRAVKTVDDLSSKLLQNSNISQKQHCCFQIRASLVGRAGKKDRNSIKYRTRRTSF